MRTRTVARPGQYDPRELLSMVEGTPDAFTEGRRNNDLVNWFIAKRLVDLGTSLPDERNRFDMSDDYEEDFRELTQKLTEAQQDSLRFWDENSSSKIYRLVCTYHAYSAQQLMYLWLPMDYAEPVHENQMSLED